MYEKSHGIFSFEHLLVLFHTKNQHGAFHKINQNNVT